MVVMNFVKHFYVIRPAKITLYRYNKITMVCNPPMCCAKCIMIMRTRMMFECNGKDNTFISI